MRRVNRTGEVSTLWFMLPTTVVLWLLWIGSMDLDCFQKLRNPRSPLKRSRARDYFVQAATTACAHVSNVTHGTTIEKNNFLFERLPTRYISYYHTIHPLLPTIEAEPVQARKIERYRPRTDVFSYLSLCGAATVHPGLSLSAQASDQQTTRAGLTNLLCQFDKNNPSLNLACGAIFTGPNTVDGKDLGTLQCTIPIQRR